MNPPTPVSTETDSAAIDPSRASAEVSDGHLYVVATPIGNLGDLSPRALRVLSAVNAICAEDTRVTGGLLSHFGVRARLIALHEHNETEIAGKLVTRLLAGESLALVSDAGTPLVSDPGFALVRASRAAGVPVMTVPGPCAVVAALSVSGLPSDRFVFEGFLPSRRGARRSRLEALADCRDTLIVYESSHRIAECLTDCAEVLGAARRICLARELSKRFEQSITDTASRLCEWLAEDGNRSRGEFVLVIEGAADSAQPDEVDRILRALLGELEPSRAARVAAELTGQRKNALYKRALEMAAGAAESPDRVE